MLELGFSGGGRMAGRAVLTNCATGIFVLYSNYLSFQINGLKELYFKLGRISKKSCPDTKFDGK